MSADLTYAPFDQHKHLGEPPWKPDDPAVKAWEQAHGHDVRLKCYPEFGCQAIADECERLRDQVDALKAERDRAKEAVRNLDKALRNAVKERGDAPDERDRLRERVNNLRADLNVVRTRYPTIWQSSFAKKALQSDDARAALDSDPDLAERTRRIRADE